MNGTRRYLLLGRDYPIPSKFFKVHGKFVSTASGLLAGFVAIESDVSLDPRPPFRLEFLGLYLEIRRVLAAGISFDHVGISSMVATGCGNLQGYPQIVPRMLEPLGYHSS